MHTRRMSALGTGFTAGPPRARRCLALLARVLGHLHRVAGVTAR